MRGWPGGCNWVTMGAMTDDPRGQVLAELRLTASISDYAATRIGDGISAEEARLAANAVAAELELAAGKLRQLAGRWVRPGPLAPWPA